MRHVSLAVALAVGISGCFEIGQGVLPEASPKPEPEASPGAKPEDSPSPSAEPPPPLPLLPFVKRLNGADRLFLYDAAAQVVVEIPEAATGGPILNPFYFEVRREGRILYNSGGLTRECPPGSGERIWDITSFGAYVLDLPRRLRLRLSTDDFFFSVATADGRLFAHLDANDLPPPQEVELVLEGEAPFDDESIVAELGLEPGLLVDVAMAAGGGWIVAVKGAPLASGCAFPPPVAGRLYLYDLNAYRLVSLSEAFGLPPIQSAAISPSGRYVAMSSGDRLLLLDRLSGAVDLMPVLNQARGGGRFGKVRFLAGGEDVFYLELLPPGSPCRIYSYDWRAQRLNPLSLLNALEEPADLYLAPPY